MCVRTALGAQRSRIIRQLLTESVLLAVLGGIAGLARRLSWSTHAARKLAFPGAQNVPIDATPSPLGHRLRVRAFAVDRDILFGVAPAWIAAQAKPAEALQVGSRGPPLEARRCCSGAWLVLQAALSLVLLVGAGLFAQSLDKLEGTDMKLDCEESLYRRTSIRRPQAIRTTQLEPLYRHDRAAISRDFPASINVGISAPTRPWKTTTGAIQRSDSGRTRIRIKGHPL